MKTETITITYEQALFLKQALSGFVDMGSNDMKQDIYGAIFDAEKNLR